MHLKYERVGKTARSLAGECSPAAPWVTSSDLAAHAVRRCCQGGVSPPYQPHTCRRGARRAEARKAAFAPVGRLCPSQHGVPRCSRVPGGSAITHTPTRGTTSNVTRPREGDRGWGGARTMDGATARESAFRPCRIRAIPLALPLPWIEDATEVSGVDGVVIRAPMSLVLPEASVHASARPRGARHHLARLDLRTRGLCVSAQQSPIARR